MDPSRGSIACSVMQMEQGLYGIYTVISGREVT